jgi:hypothetical protein
MAKSVFNKRTTLQQQIELKLNEDTSEVLHLEHFTVWVLKLGHFGRPITSTWKVLKCGAEEKRRRLVRPIV